MLSKTIANKNIEIIKDYNRTDYEDEIKNYFILQLEDMLSEYYIVSECPVDIYHDDFGELILNNNSVMRIPIYSALKASESYFPLHAACEWPIKMIVYCICVLYELDMSLLDNVSDAIEYVKIASVYDKKFSSHEFYTPFISLNYYDPDYLFSLRSAMVAIGLGDEEKVEQAKEIIDYELKEYLKKASNSFDYYDLRKLKSILRRH